MLLTPSSFHDRTKDVCQRHRFVLRPRPKQMRLPRKIKKGYRKKAFEAAMALALANQTNVGHTGASSRGSASTASADTTDDRRRRAAGVSMPSGRRRPGWQGVAANHATGHTKMDTKVIGAYLSRG